MYKYPDGYRMGEYTYPDHQHGGVLTTMPVTEHDVQGMIGSHVLLGGAEINRHRIRTRCGQARVLITVICNGSVRAAYDVADNDPRVTADVTFDPDDLSARYASIGLNRTF